MSCREDREIYCPQCRKNVTIETAVTRKDEDVLEFHIKTRHDITKMMGVNKVGNVGLSMLERRFKELKKKHLKICSLTNAEGYDVKTVKKYDRLIIAYKAVIEDQKEIMGMTDE